MRGVGETRPAGHEGKGGGFGRKGETREEEEERIRMAPNMGARGSQPQAISDPGEEEAAEGHKKDL